MGVRRCFCLGRLDNKYRRNYGILKKSSFCDTHVIIGSGWMLTLWEEGLLMLKNRMFPCPPQTTLENQVPVKWKDRLSAP